MAPDMQAGLGCRALQLALVQRRPAPGLIVHTDRGSQYASTLHQALLPVHGLVSSMSRKGNCWDNAVMERFFLNLKMERVWQRAAALQTGQGATQCLRAAIGNQSTYRGVRKNLTRTHCHGTPPIALPSSSKVSSS